MQRFNTHIQDETIKHLFQTKPQDLNPKRTKNKNTSSYTHQTSQRSILDKNYFIATYFNQVEFLVMEDCKYNDCSPANYIQSNKYYWKCNFEHKNKICCGSVTTSLNVANAFQYGKKGAVIGFTACTPHRFTWTISSAKTQVMKHLLCMF